MADPISSARAAAERAAGRTVGRSLGRIADRVKGPAVVGAYKLGEALAQNVFDWPQAVELADVVAGKHPGRTRDSDNVLFKSVGLAIEDVALGAKVLELARQKGVGRELSL